ncbi:unnamed protein product [Amoebophrya sp. A25]|nr:unnamed protein product [Amoebophrya sp. A25]|eukprot:GSA25T00006991001.1
MRSLFFLELHDEDAFVAEVSMLLHQRLQNAVARHQYLRKKQEDGGAGGERGSSNAWSKGQTSAASMKNPASGTAANDSSTTAVKTTSKHQSRFQAVLARLKNFRDEDHDHANKGGENILASARISAGQMKFLNVVERAQKEVAGPTQWAFAEDFWDELHAYLGLVGDQDYDSTKKNEEQGGGDRNCTLVLGGGDTHDSRGSWAVVNSASPVSGVGSRRSRPTGSRSIRRLTNDDNCDVVDMRKSRTATAVVRGDGTTTCKNHQHSDKYTTNVQQDQFLTSAALSGLNLREVDLLFWTTLADRSRAFADVSKNVKPSSTSSSATWGTLGGRLLQYWWINSAEEVEQKNTEAKEHYENEKIASSSSLVLTRNTTTSPVFDARASIEAPDDEQDEQDLFEDVDPVSLTVGDHRKRRTTTRPNAAVAKRRTTRRTVIGGQASTGDRDGIRPSLRCASDESDKHNQDRETSSKTRPGPSSTTIFGRMRRYVFPALGKVRLLSKEVKAPSDDEDIDAGGDGLRLPSGVTRVGAPPRSGNVGGRNRRGSTRLSSSVAAEGLGHQTQHEIVLHDPRSSCEQAATRKTIVETRAVGRGMGSQPAFLVKEEDSEHHNNTKKQKTHRKSSRSPSRRTGHTRFGCPMIATSTSICTSNYEFPNSSSSSMTPRRKTSIRTVPAYISHYENASRWLRRTRIFRERLALARLEKEMLLGGSSYFSCNLVVEGSCTTSNNLQRTRPRAGTSRKTVAPAPFEEHQRQVVQDYEEDGELEEHDTTTPSTTPHHPHQVASFNMHRNNKMISLEKDRNHLRQQRTTCLHRLDFLLGNIPVSADIPTEVRLEFENRQDEVFVGAARKMQYRMPRGLLAKVLVDLGGGGGEENEKTTDMTTKRKNGEDDRDTKMASTSTSSSKHVGGVGEQGGQDDATLMLLGVDDETRFRPTSVDPQDADTSTTSSAPAVGVLEAISSLLASDPLLCRNPPLLCGVQTLLEEEDATFPRGGAGGATRQPPAEEDKYCQQDESISKLGLQQDLSANQRGHEDAAPAPVGPIVSQSSSSSSSSSSTTTELCPLKDPHPQQQQITRRSVDDLMWALTGASSPNRKRSRHRKRHQFRATDIFLRDSKANLPVEVLGGKLLIPASSSGVAHLDGRQAEHQGPLLAPQEYPDTTPATQLAPPALGPLERQRREILKEVESEMRQLMDREGHLATKLEKLRSDRDVVYKELGQLREKEARRIADGVKLREKVHEYYRNREEQLREHESLREEQARIFRKEKKLKKKEEDKEQEERRRREEYLKSLKEKRKADLAQRKRDQIRGSEVLWDVVPDIVQQERDRQHAAKCQLRSDFLKNTRNTHASGTRNKKQAVVKNHDINTISISSKEKVDKREQRTASATQRSSTSTSDKKCSGDSLEAAESNVELEEENISNEGCFF